MFSKPAKKGLTCCMMVRPNATPALSVAYQPILWCMAVAPLAPWHRGTVSRPLPQPIHRFSGHIFARGEWGGVIIAMHWTGGCSLPLFHRIHPLCPFEWPIITVSVRRAQIDRWFPKMTQELRKWTGVHNKTLMDKMLYENTNTIGSEWSDVLWWQRFGENGA